MRRWLFAALAMWIVSVSPGLAADPCEPCTLPAGTYHVAVPPDWDGRSKLRLLLFLHGWKQKGTDMTGDANIAGVANRLGFLLVAPDGAVGAQATGWSFDGSPERTRDDRAFLMAVLHDVERRWPIDMDAVVAGGFSLGGSMAWDLACNRAQYFTAFIPFAGGFWEPMPDGCTAGVVALRHTHGLHDRMVPMTGRAILGGRFHQGDILDWLKRWLTEDRCAAEPDQVTTEADLTCRRWTRCEQPGEVELCLHDGDHSMIAPWLEASLRWSLTVRSAPAQAP
jgi:polyhydroxybutyrate depolymerase